MSEYNQTSDPRLLALLQYIKALELGNIEMLTAVLNKASHDPILSALLAEMDTVYQTIDGTGVSEREARRALQSVLKPDLNGRLTQNHQSTLIDEIPIPYDDRRKKETSMEGQITLLLPRITSRRAQAERRHGFRRVLQLFAALLVVCVLIGGMATLSYLYTQSGRGTPGTPPLALNSQVGKTVYSRGQSALFSNVSSIAWSPDSKRFASLAFNGVQIWAATTGAHMVTFKLTGDLGEPWDMAWSPDGKWIAIAASGGLAIMNAQTGAIVHQYTDSSLTSVQLTSQGSFLTTTMPESGGGPLISGLAWSPDSSRLAITGGTSVADERDFRIINPQTGKVLHSITEPANDSIYAASWSFDGKYLAAYVTDTGSGTTEVWAWNTSTYQVVFKQSTGLTNLVPTIQEQPIAWQPHSDNLIFADSNISSLRYNLEAPTITLWNVAQNKLLHQYGIDNTGAFTWSPDGKYFATGSYENNTSGNQVAAVNAQTGRIVYSYKDQAYQTLAVAWSPNGKYIASSDVDMIKVWIAP